MTQTVRVRAVHDDGTAQVLHIRQSACSGECHKCSGCGAAQEALLITAQNPIGAEAGDLVLLTSRTAPVLKAAAVLYLLPLALFFLGYWAGASLWDKGPLVGCGAFAAAIAAVVLYDRCVARKRETVYTITGYAPSGES